MDQKESDNEGDICLRLVFCEFLAACTYTTLARAEDNIESCVRLRHPNSCSTLVLT
jgi:hypothetical protein